MKKFIILLNLIPLHFLANGQIDKVYTSLDEALKNPEQVYHLNLSKQDLGSLPKDIKKLTSLKTLDLRDNRFTDFPSFARFDKLEKLDLSDNPLKWMPSFIELTGTERNVICENVKIVAVLPSNLVAKDISQAGFEGKIRAGSKYTISSEKDSKGEFIKLVPVANAEIWIEIRKRGSKENKHFVDSVQNLPLIEFDYFINRHLSFENTNDTLPDFLLYEYTNQDGKVGIISSGATVLLPGYILSLNTSKRYIHLSDAMDLLGVALTYRPKSGMNNNVKTAGIDPAKLNALSLDNVKQDKIVAAANTTVNEIVSYTTDKKTIYTLKSGETVAFTNEYQLGVKTANQQYYVYLKKGGKYYIQTATKLFGPYDALNSADPNYSSNYDIAHTFQATKGGKTYYVVAGAEYGPFSNSSSIEYETGDNGAYNFVVAEYIDDKVYITYKGKKSGPYNSTSIVDFYNLKPVFKSYNENKLHTVYLDGEAIYSNLDVFNWRLVENGYLFFKFKKDEKSFLRLNEKQYGPFDEIKNEMVDEKGVLKMTYTNGGKQYALIGTETFGPYDEIDNFSTTLGSFTYKAEGKYYVRDTDGKIFGPFAEISDLITRSGNDAVITHGKAGSGAQTFSFAGKTYGPFQGVYQVQPKYYENWNSKDGLPCILTQNTDKTFSIYFKNEVFEKIPDEPIIYFSSDNKTIAYSYKISPKGNNNQYFVKDGVKYGPLNIIFKKYISGDYSKTITSGFPVILEDSKNNKIAVDSYKTYSSVKKFSYSSSYNNFIAALFMDNEWYQLEENKLTGPLAVPAELKDEAGKTKIYVNDSKEQLYYTIAVDYIDKSSLINGMVYDRPYYCAFAEGNKHAYIYVEDETKGITWFLINRKETMVKNVLNYSFNKEDKTLYWVVLEGTSLVQYSVKF